MTRIQFAGKIITADENKIPSRGKKITTSGKIISSSETKTPTGGNQNPIAGKTIISGGNGITSGWEKITTSGKNFRVPHIHFVPSSHQLAKCGGGAYSLRTRDYSDFKQCLRKQRPLYFNEVQENRNKMIFG